MPSIAVTPEILTESPGGGPRIAGLAFPRPSSRSENVEPIRQILTLGNGSERAYDRGVRGVHAFAWSRLLEEEVDRLRAAIAAPYVTLERSAGEPPVVVSTEGGISADAIAGTFPIRYSVSLTLRERDPR